MNPPSPPRHSIVILPDHEATQPRMPPKCPPNAPPIRKTARHIERVQLPNGGSAINLCTCKMEINRGSDMHRSHSVCQLSMVGSLFLSMRGLGFRVMMDRPCLQCGLVCWFNLMDERHPNQEVWTKLKLSNEEAAWDPMHVIRFLQRKVETFNHGQGHSKLNQAIEKSTSLLAINVT